MPYELRRLSAEDQSAAWNLGSLSFGYHATPMPENWAQYSPGRHSWGVFDGSGRLVAKAVDREQGQWFGGRLVPTSGIAGVAVVADQRRHGLGRMVLAHTLVQARDRGAAISTLFPTTPFPYRRLGWEEVGALTYYAIPTAALTGVRPAGGAELRPAVGDDIPAIEALYREVASSSVGMMERAGLLFQTPPAEFLASYDGVTVALGPSGAIEGYTSWDRGPGYDASGKVTVDDLVAATPAAAGALLAMLGSWANVAPTLVMRLAPDDPAWLHFDRAAARVESRQPWMLRLVDAAGAIAARGWPAHLTTTVDLHLEDEACPWNSGPHRLTLASGEGKLEPGGTGQIRLTERGAALWYAGAATPGNLRRLGMLSGDDGADPLLQAATAGPIPVLHDYF